MIIRDCRECKHWDDYGCVGWRTSCPRCIRSASRKKTTDELGAMRYKEVGVRDASKERAACWLEAHLLGRCGKEGRFFEPRAGHVRTTITITEETV